MADFETFSRRIVILGDRVNRNANLLVRRVALVADQALVLGTPVDEGRARSNWLVSVGQPRRDVIEPYSPGKGLGIGEGSNAQGAINQARAAIAGQKDGQAIYISNNLPYIEPLNNGSSAQAPAGFVEMAINKAVQVANQGRLL